MIHLKSSLINSWKKQRKPTRCIKNSQIWRFFLVRIFPYLIWIRRFVKTFEKIIFTSMFEYLIEIKLFSLSVWFSSRWFLHFTTLNSTWDTKIVWWKSTYRWKKYLFRHLLRRLIKVGIKGLSINSNRMEFLVIFLNLSKTT